METEIVYKVVYRFTENILLSCMECGKLQLKYFVGEWTKPKLGKIFVFKVLVDAQEFVDQYRKTLEIYRAEACNVVKAPEYLCGYQLQNELFWMDMKAWLDNPHHTLMDVPYGTFMCDQVKLIEKVGEN